MSDVLTLRTWYLDHAFANPRTIIKQAREHLNGVDYDTLIGTGLSGALIVPLLGRSLKTEWAVVRKDGDGSHAWSRVEGTIGRRWVFVDDLIDSGTTFERVKRRIEAEANSNRHETESVGAYLYYNYGLPTFTTADQFTD